MNHFENNHKIILIILLLFIFILTACESSDDHEGNVDIANTEESTTIEPTNMDISDEKESEGTTTSAELDTWLQQVKNGEITSDTTGETIAWRLGYFTYYGSLESTGIDNMIYYALQAHRRLDTGEFTLDNISQNAKNLLDVTEGIQYDSVAPLTDQIWQSPEVKNAILEHIVQSQQELSPQEALDSNNFIGVFAPPSPGSVGGKYLVYIQDSPDSDFSFLGVIIAVDAATHGENETFDIDEWKDIFWLGDASGPYWVNLPITGGADPNSTKFIRPGVLLINEETFAEIDAGDFE